MVKDAAIAATIVVLGLITLGAIAADVCTSLYEPKPCMPPMLAEALCFKKCGADELIKCIPEEHLAVCLGDSGYWLDTETKMPEKGEEEQNAIRYEKPDSDSLGLRLECGLCPH